MGGDSGNMGNVENVKRVVFVGNPNVGKSSMFNALLGARTRTMNAPGTTVDSRPFPGISDSPCAR